MPTLEDLKTYLDGLVARFEQPVFIQDDPIAFPHGFDDPRDQEEDWLLQVAIELLQLVRWRLFFLIVDARSSFDLQPLNSCKFYLAHIGV